MLQNVDLKYILLAGHNISLWFSQFD